MSVFSVFRPAGFAAVLFLLAACTVEPTSKTYVCRNASAGQYCVQGGDSLSRIAQRFQTDVAKLKAWNNLKSDVIRPGQVLTVKQAAPAPEPRTAMMPTIKTPPAVQSGGGFALQWPLRGSVVVPYGGANKGIDIAAPRGTLVHAAADGTVMYSGSDVSGYGKLLLIRHNDSVITAYANNENLLVSDKAQVKAGQIVASVGDSGRDDGRTALHFEVRVNGKHVNPSLYLK